MHPLFADNLKTYLKSEQKAAVVSRKLNDIGLEWGINKCAAINLKIGHPKAVKIIPCLPQVMMPISPPTVTMTTKSSLVTFKTLI